MGLFVSLCNTCDAEITWFLHAPENHVCGKCGGVNSKASIEESWVEWGRMWQQIVDDTKTISPEDIQVKYAGNRYAASVLRKMPVKKW